MQRLRSEGLVGIFALDKYKRFGILKPMDSSTSGNGGDNNGELQVEDCFAACYIGNANDVKSFLKGGNAVAAAPAASDEVVPKTPPVPESGFGDSNSNGLGSLREPTTVTAVAASGNLLVLKPIKEETPRVVAAAVVACGNPPIRERNRKKTRGRLLATMITRVMLATATTTPGTLLTATRIRPMKTTRGPGR